MGRRTHVSAKVPFNPNHAVADSLLFKANCPDNKFSDEHAVG